MKQPNKVRRSLSFSRPIDNSIEAIAERHGLTYSQAIRDAVVLKEWFDKAREDGRRILVEDENGTREITPL